MPLSQLPIGEVLSELISGLRRHPCAVLRAPTGSGKTTRAPAAILDAGLAGAGQVLLLQPRRLAARAAAWRIAEERGVSLGQEVGYHVRFERRATRNTRLLVLTEGMFVRMLQADPLLENVGAVVFDEFHERTLDADLALAMSRRLQIDVRPDLKLLVMSATLDPEPIARYLGDCPRVEATGRMYPVETSYQKHDDRAPIPDQVASGVLQIAEQTAGDVLAFLPGVGEIRRTSSSLSDWARDNDVALMELYGDLPLERQQAVLRPSDRRKIVLSTNVAETSVTIDGITGVVDCGWARINRLDPSHGINRLDLSRISRASAEQRAGRAGRTGPGVCLRLWTQQTHRALAEHDTPEIRRVDLSGALLHLLCWDEQAARDFTWFEPPNAESLRQAMALLNQLGAISDRGLTQLGRRMGRMPVEPRIARLLCAGQQLGHIERVALVGALLSERDPFYRPGESGPPAAARHWSQSDVLDRAIALEEYERTGRPQTSLGPIDLAAAKFILRSRDQLLRATNEDESLEATLAEGECGADEAAQRAILFAYADRVARRRESGGLRAVMVGGHGVRLHPKSAVRDARLFACVDIEDVGKPESLVRQASAVERDWLPRELLSVNVDVQYDAERKRIVAYRRERFIDLAIDEAATNVPVDFDAGQILAQVAADQLDDHFFQDEAGLNYLARVRSLAVWMPELNLPQLGADPLRTILGDVCRGRRSIEEVRRAPLTPVIQTQLTPEQIRMISREAPERLPVPSGSLIALRYEFGQSPVMAVRIQEVFGLRQTPRIAAGRVPVVMHLLAPNMRPQQVTSDLESFWRTTYAGVRKELRRRYPKHSWPEDPTTAQAVQRPGQRS